MTTPLGGGLFGDDGDRFRRLLLDENAPASFRTPIESMQMFLDPRDADSFEKDGGLQRKWVECPQVPLQDLVDMMSMDGDLGARSMPHRAGSTRREGHRRDDSLEGDTRTTLHFCDPKGQEAVCYGTATRGEQRLVCITENCPHGHKPNQREDLDRGFYVKSPPGRGTPTMFPTHFTMEEAMRRNPGL